MNKLLIALILISTPCYSEKLCSIEKEKEELVVYRVLLIKMGIKRVYESIYQAEMPEDQKQKIIKNMENLEVYLGFSEFCNR